MEGFGTLGDEPIRHVLTWLLLFVPAAVLVPDPTGTTTVVLWVACCLAFEGLTTATTVLR
ncbi:hypothetical protein [Haloarchaeobius sp. DFWS5]|uniref:hypothetical protein n=1 Tax=Haloarchaeobius sp. DFWS5 TaxID=3446114 RepID=UPI003EBFDD3B